MKTRRDVNRRCVACGRRPDEECCGDCHRGFAWIQPRRPISLCVVDDCSNRHKARGYCATHYSRWKANNGDVFPNVPVGKPGQNFKRRRTSESV